MALIATYSPRFVALKPDTRGAWAVDIQRFGRVVRGETEPLPEIVTDPSLADFRRLLESGQPLGCDIETAPEAGDSTGESGKHPNRCQLRTIAFGHCDFAIAVHWGTASNSVREHVRSLLKDDAVTKVFHNGVHFDMPVLVRYNMPVENWEDTRLARRALSSTSQLSLRYLGSLYSDLPPWKEGDEGDDAKGMVETEDVQKLLHYNGMDAAITARVWRALTAEPAWAEERVQALYTQHRGTDTVAAEMYQHGVHVSQAGRERCTRLLSAARDRREGRLRKLVGSETFRCTPNDMRKLLYERYATSGIPCYGLPDPDDSKRWTEGGDIAVDFDSLLQVFIDPTTPEQLRTQIRLYWGAEEAKKALSTFVQSAYVLNAIHPDGYLRPGWNACGTDTGRWSCSQPNVMNLRQSLRCMYEASPGNLLVHADYSQLELRVMAAVAPDEELQARLDRGDVYTADAIDWFQLPPTSTKKTIKPAARRAAKIIHLGSQYGASPPTVHRQALAQDYGFKWDLTRRLCAGFQRTYRQTVEYWHRELAAVCAAGYSETRITGRRRYYAKEPELSAVANYPIQGTAADIANAAMLRIRERLRLHVPRAALVFQLHDAFDVDCPEADVPTVEGIMREEMERPVSIAGCNYTFPVEIKVARSWQAV